MNTENTNTAFFDIAVPAGTSLKYTNPYSKVTETLTIGVPDNDGVTVIALLLDHTGEVYEWLTEDTYHETVRNFAANSNYMIYWDMAAGTDAPDFDPDVHMLIAIAKQSRAEYADCFGVHHYGYFDASYLPDDWVNGNAPILTSQLAV